MGRRSKGSLGIIEVEGKLDKRNRMMPARDTDPYFHTLPGYHQIVVAVRFAKREGDYSRIVFTAGDHTTRIRVKETKTRNPDEKRNTLGRRYTRCTKSINCKTLRDQRDCMRL